MFIRDILNTTKPVVSFEIFPPKRDYPIETIYETIDALKDLSPEFISVTYGAGGSSRERTVEIASSIENKYGIKALAHLTCITSTKEEINVILNELKLQHINNILALRGDFPNDENFDPQKLPFKFAKDLIQHISHFGGFCIGGAAYPEGHIDCPDKLLNLKYLKEKVDVGLDFLTTQLFLNNEFFYKFFDDTKKLNINIPILAGIMPVLNAKQIERIVSLCGVSIPDNLLKIMQKYYNDPDSMKQAGIDYATKQIIELLSWGVDGVHLYTMNRPDITRTIMNNISKDRQNLSEKTKSQTYK